MAYNPYTGRWEMDGAQQIQLQPMPRPQGPQLPPQPPKLGVLTVASEASINNTETDLELSGCCCCVNHTFTLVATTDSTAAGSVIELCTGLLKLA